MTTKLAAFLAWAFFALFHPLLAFAQTQQPRWDWPGPWHMWNDGFWWIFPLMMLFLIAMCVAMFLFARTSGGGHTIERPQGDPTASALQILNERFAKGEIHKQEYQERKAALLTMMAPGGQA